MSYFTFKKKKSSFDSDLTHVFLYNLYRNLSWSERTEPSHDVIDTSRTGWDQLHVELKKSKQKPNSSIGFSHPGFDHSFKVGVFEQLATTLCLAPCLPVSLLKNPMKLFQINEKNVHVKPNKTNNQNRTVSHNSSYKETPNKGTIDPCFIT